jgi:hypothetical protein
MLPSNLITHKWPNLGPGSSTVHPLIIICITQGRERASAICVRHSVHGYFAFRPLGTSNDYGATRVWRVALLRRATYCLQFRHVCKDIGIAIKWLIISGTVVSVSFGFTNQTSQPHIRLLQDVILSQLIRPGNVREAETEPSLPKTPECSMRKQ